MGDQYAKLLREMALSAGVKVLLGDRVKDADRILFTGKSVHVLGDYPQKPLLLLSPEKILNTELDVLTSRNKLVKILLPEIDEDGRFLHWPHSDETH